MRSFITWNKINDTSIRRYMRIIASVSTNLAFTCTSSMLETWISKGSDPGLTILTVKPKSWIKTTSCSFAVSFSLSTASVSFSFFSSLFFSFSPSFVASTSPFSRTFSVAVLVLPSSAVFCFTSANNKVHYV